MKGLFIPDITEEMFRGGCLESIEILMNEGEMYDIDYPMDQLKQEPCKYAKDKAFNSAMFIRGLYNGLRMFRPDYNADDYKWIIGKAVWNEFEEQNKKYRLLPMLEDTATLYGIKVEVENINIYCIKLYENITNKVDIEKDKSENRGEAIKMLTKLKEQAKENILFSDTLIEDVKLDSFNFVIDNAIELIKGGENETTK